MRRAHRRSILHELGENAVKYGQAAEAFSKAMERLRSLPVGATMLGLARLRAEAGAVLSLEVEGSRVTVSAFARW